MRKLALLAALAVSLFATVPAHAQKWVTKEIGWQISSQGSPTNSGAIYVRDTAYTAIGPVDTTAEFSLDLADVPRGVGAPAATVIGGVSGAVAANDTTTLAYVVIQSDSSAAPTAGLTGVTMFVDGKVIAGGPNLTVARGWVKADSVLVNGAAGKTMILADETVGLPIQTISPYGNIRRFAMLRARISGTGTALSACRVFVRYFCPSCR